MFVNVLNRSRIIGTYLYETSHVRQCQRKAEDQGRHHLHNRAVKDDAGQRRNFNVQYSEAPQNQVKLLPTATPVDASGQRVYLEYNDAPESQMYLQAVPRERSAFPPEYNDAPERQCFLPVTPQQTPVNEFGHEVITLPFFLDVVHTNSLGERVCNRINSLPISPDEQEEFLQLNQLILKCEQNTREWLSPKTDDKNRGKLLTEWLGSYFKNPFYMARYVLSPVSGNDLREWSTLYSQTFVYPFKKEIKVPDAVRNLVYDKVESIPVRLKTPQEALVVKQFLRLLFQSDLSAVSSQDVASVRNLLREWAEASHDNSMVVCRYIICGH